MVSASSCLRRMVARRSSWLLLGPRVPVPAAREHSYCVCVCVCVCGGGQVICCAPHGRRRGALSSYFSLSVWRWLVGAGRTGVLLLSYRVCVCRYWSD